MNEQLSFDQLPSAILEVNKRLKRIESILDTKNDDRKPSYPDRMSVEQVADYLNLAIPTIYGLVHRRLIPHEKRGKRLYFVSKEINEWLKGGRRRTIEELDSEI